MKRINYICTHCGSSDICFDAYAQWNPETQEFEVYDTFDKSWCRECDATHEDLAESNEGAAPCTD